jgi:hypothetical protein
LKGDHIESERAGKVFGNSRGEISVEEKPWHDYQARTSVRASSCLA